MGTHDRRILFVTCFGHFMSHFNMLVFPALVLPLGRQFDLDLNHVLQLSFWMYLLFGVTALPWGMVGDRWGGEPLMRVFFLGAGLSGLAATVWAGQPARLSLALAGLGLFSGIYHPIGLGMISKRVERVSIALAYNGMFGNLGLAMAPLMAGLLNWLWGPRAALLCVSCLNLAGYIVTRLLVLEDPGGEAATHEARAAGATARLPAFLVLLAAMMLGGLAYRGATVLLPTYLELKNQRILEWIAGAGDGVASANLAATAVASLIYLLGMLGQYTGGRVAERRPPGTSYLAFHAVCMPAAFLMAFASDLPLAVLAFVYFFFLLGAQPIENTLVASLAPRRLHHSAYGTKFILTFGVGALSVKAVGVIQAHHGIGACFVALGGVSVLLVAMAAGLAFLTRNHLARP